MRRMLEPDRRQPAPIGLRPALLARVNLAMPEHEALQMLARLARDTHGRCPRPNQISHRLMSLVRHPNRCQFARPMEFRQHERIAAVGLHPLASLHRDERGGHDHAVMPEFGEMPVEAIAARTGLIAEVQQTPVGAQLIGKLADMICAVGDRAPVAHFAAASSMRDCHRNRRLVDIQPDKYGILHLVSPPFMRLGASPSGATLEGEYRGRGHRPNRLSPRS